MCLWQVEVSRPGTELVRQWQPELLQWQCRILTPCATRELRVCLFVFSCQLLLFVLTCIQHSMHWIFHYVIFWKRQSYRKENISVLTRGWACCDCNTESQGVLGVIEYSTPLLLWWFQEYVLQFPELDAERDEFYWSVFAKWKSLKKCSDF